MGLLAAYNAWMPLAALLFPDVSDYDQPWEMEEFYLQHWGMMVGMAWIAMSRGWRARGPRAQMRVGVACFSAAIVYHFLVLLPVSIYTGHSINHMVLPPPELEWAGRYYRLVTIFATMPPAIVTALVLYVLPNVGRSHPVDTKEE